MDKTKVQELIQALGGLDYNEWAQIKNCVDAEFHSKITKLKLDDLSNLNRNMEINFHLRRYSE